MREVAGTLLEWLGGATPFATATVIGMRGSAPRPPGTTMAVSAFGRVVGSVSGGCVEGAVYEKATAVLDGAPAVVTSFGISDADAFSVGLTCGGVLDVLIAPGPGPGAPAEALAEVLRSVVAGESVAVVTTVGVGRRPGRRLGVWPDRVAGTLGEAALDAVATRRAREALAAGVAAGLEVGTREAAAGLFIQTFVAPPDLLVFGAVDFAGALVRVGKLLGFRVTVCDARPVFAIAERFPDADGVVCEWPAKFLARRCAEGALDARSAVCVLTHDPKFDVPLLRAALRSAAGYVGAMGSRRTHADRVRRLRAEGLGDAELGRLRSPIGLDIGARTAEETAVSIAAEIIGSRRGGTGRPLATTDGPIHRVRADTPPDCR